MSPMTLPEQEWFILQEIFYKNNGPFWKMKLNWDFTNISMNNPCINDWYGLMIGLFPKCSISSIDLSKNNLSGVLPSSFGNFSRLISLNLPSNSLHGSLPSFLNMPLLQIVNLRNNSFSGSIPSNMFPNPSVILQTLELESNRLSGTLPEWLYYLPRIKLLSLDNNHLSGTISPQISNLVALRYFSIRNNRFYGSLPTSMVSFHHVNSFFVDNNFFSGSLPSIKAIWLSATDNNLDGPIPIMVEELLLADFHLTSNYFTGTISPSICRIASLLHLSVADNRLTGTIPPCVLSIASLETLELDYNMFHGSLYFSNSSHNHLNHVQLQTISFGFNQFSGSFPIDLFYLPKLQAISAPSNCFQGGLNKLNCDHQYLSTSSAERPFVYLNLDGLYSPYSCNNHYFFQSMHSFGGSLPICLLSSVQYEISMTGNGFRGTLPNYFLSRKINLSHNYLTGTIPASLENVSLHYLDLSYNKLHGHIPKLYFIGSEEEKDFLVVQNNRLSLSRQDAIILQSRTLNINMLVGNLFQCNNRNPWPLDLNSPICQTSFYSNYQLIILLSYYICVSFVIYLLQKLTLNFPSIINRHNNEIIQKLAYFYILFLLLINLVLLPFYYFMQTSNNLKWKFYEETFDWLFSSVYLRGEWISIVVALLLILLNILIVVLFQGQKNRRELKKRIVSTIFPGSNFFTLILNFIISMIVNLTYVKMVNSREGLGLGLSYEIEVALIQVGLVLYNVVWNRYVLVWMLKYLRSDNKGGRWEYEYRLMLLLINGVIGPWLSVMLRDGSCFEGLLFGRREVNRVIGSTECLYFANSKICHRRTSFSLPFLYYNTCGWKIITTYLPVWIMVYLFECIANGVRLGLMFLFPSFQTNLIIFINNKFVNFSIFLFDFTLLLCYGIHSPLFSLIVIIKMILECWSFSDDNICRSKQTQKELELVSFHKINSFHHSSLIEEEEEVVVTLFDSPDSNDEKEQNEMKFSTKSLNHHKKNNEVQHEIFIYSWQIMYCSILFNSIIFYDMIADEIGVIAGLFFVIILFMIALIIHLFFDLIWNSRRSGKTVRSVRRERSEKYESIRNDDDGLI